MNLISCTFISWVAGAGKTATSWKTTAKRGRAGATGDDQTAASVYGELAAAYGVSEAEFRAAASATFGASYFI